MKNQYQFNKKTGSLVFLLMALTISQFSFAEDAPTQIPTLDLPAKDMTQLDIVQRIKVITEENLALKATQLQLEEKVKQQEIIIQNNQQRIIALTEQITAKSSSAH